MKPIQIWFCGSVTVTFAAVVQVRLVPSVVTSTAPLPEGTVQLPARAGSAAIADTAMARRMAAANSQRDRYIFLPPGRPNPQEKSTSRECCRDGKCKLHVSSCRHGNEDAGE